MDAIQAPYGYVAEHYRHTANVDVAFPEVAEFVYSGLRRVSGKRVVNLGCGATFYDYLPYFGECPEVYVGVDLNRSTFEFLRSGEHPRLCAVRDQVGRMGVVTEFLCADAYDYLVEVKPIFDTALGVGFFGTFEGAELDRLLRATRRALGSDGRLVKITWHGPHRTPEQTALKHKYGYDNSEEISPEALVEVVRKAGFELQENAIMACDPEAYRWDAVQVCEFSVKRDDVAEVASK